MSSPNDLPNQNPNAAFNPDQMSYTNLMLFGTPNTPGSAGSPPIRHQGPQQYGMYPPPPPPPYYQPYDYSQQQQQPYYHHQQPYYQQPPPLFHSQQPQQPEPQQPEPSTQRAGKGIQESPRKRSHKKRADSGPKTCPKKAWSGMEEAWLATCWCDTSEDPITGTDQKKGQLWATVEEKFNSNNQGWVRYADALSSKMRYINKYCKDFTDIYEAQNSLAKRGSGNCDEMVYNRSVEEYFKIHKRSWNMKEAWNVVKFHPKWRKIHGVQQDYQEFEDSVDLSDDRTTPFTNELFEDDPLPRPIGRNKAKKIARSSGSSDAGSASRASTGKSKLEEIAECMTHRNTEMFQAKKKAVETFTYNENLRTAMQGVQFLNTDTSRMDPKTLRAHTKMCKKIMEKFADFYDTDNEEEGGDGGGEEGSDSSDE